MSECNYDTSSGHFPCTIPYTGTYNSNYYSSTGINDNYGKITELPYSTVLINGGSSVRVKIFWGPKIPEYGYLKTDTKNIDLKNNVEWYPKNKVIYGSESILIPAVEIYVYNGKVSRIFGIYYSEISNLFNPSKWKGYNEEGRGLIDISEGNREDIIIGDSGITNGENIMLRGTFTDSVLCGIYYNTDIPGNTINNICCVFRRFLNRESQTEYIGYEGGKYFKRSKNEGIWKSGYECLKGRFLNSIQVAYTDFSSNDGSQYFANIPIAKTETTKFNVGLKGIVSVRETDYNVKDGLYQWIADIDTVKCCSTLTDEQYDKDSVEKKVCEISFGLDVRNEFPNVYPNGNCKLILADHCNKVENIDSEMCELACGINDINCDTGILKYCDKEEFKYEGKLNLDALWKDKVCACSFTENKDDIQSSFASSLDLYIKNKILNKSSISSTLRQECSSSACYKSKYKMKYQKDNLMNKSCTPNEVCLGEGYQIPSFTDNNTKVDCKRYMQGDFDCVEPLQPSITMIPDPRNAQCKNIIDRQPETFEFKPQMCELMKTPDKGPCVEGPNGKYYSEWKYNIKIPSIPSDDPNMCPPYEDPEDPSSPRKKMSKKVRCFPDEEEEEDDGESTPTSKIYIGIFIFIILMIMTIIIYRRIKK